MAIGDGKAKAEVKGINEEIGFILDAITSIGDKLVASFEDAVDGAGDLGNAVDVVGKTVQRGLVADLKSAVKSTENLINLSAKLARGTLKQSDIAKEQERIAFNRAKIEAKRQIFGNKLTKQQQALLAAEEEEINAQEAVLKKIEAKNNALQKQKGLFQIIKENSSDIANKIDDTGQLAKILNGQIGLLFTPLRLAEMAIIGVFTAFKSADEQAGELAKSLNLSYGEAVELQAEMQSVANLSGNMTITGKGLTKALMAQNEALGISTTVITDNLITFQKLHKTAGLTYEELEGIKSITDATGGDLEKNTKELLAQSRITATNLGVALNEKDVLKDINNVSKATTVSLGMSTKEIAKAVTTAKALGIELETIEGISDSILNFEESIEKELQAELLTGKNLSLERARQLALENDIAGVAKEIADQVGSAAEFGEMNRIQQQALADAVGMSREELAKSLFVQEQIGNLTGEEFELRKAQIEKLEAQGLSQAQIKEKLGKTSINQLKDQNSLQENLTKATDKLKESFASIAIPLMQIINPIAKLLIPAVGALAILLSPITEGFKVISDSVSGLYGFITGTNDELTVMQGIVGAIVAGYTAYMALTKGIQVIQGITNGIIMARTGMLSVQRGLEASALTRAVGTAIFNVISSFSKIPFGVGVGLGLVAAAGIASMASKYLKANDLFSPGTNSSGYGSRTLFGPEGAIALNNKDTVIAGTDLFKKGDDVVSSPAGAIQIPDNSEAKRTNRLLTALINRPAPKVQMDSIDVGTVAGMSAFSIQ